jgi:hypothetical protein
MKMEATQMKQFLPGTKLIMFVLILTSLTLTPLLAVPVHVHAEGTGIGMSSTFSGQTFEIPQGSSLSSPSYYIVVFNQGEKSYGVNMLTDAPVGTNINLSHTNFILEPGEQQKISIEICVTEDAAGGEFPIGITAESYIENPGGEVYPMPAACHMATLKVIGESANVTINAVSPDGKPVIAELRLFKLIEGRNQEVAYDVSTSSLNAIVAPGTFLAQAYVGGQLLDEETFDVAADETKTIELMAGTIYFENPGLLPYYDKDTDELAFINIYYTVRNVYEPTDNVATKLLVTLDGNILEQKDDFTIPTLVIGRASGSIDYYPHSGNGVYGFTLQLFVDGNLYTYSPEMTFEVGNDGGSSGTGDDSNIPLIVGIVCAVVILLGIAYFMIYRSRKAKHNKSGTKKKKRKTRRE